MGRNVTKEEKQARIEEIIVQTNLAKAQDTYIGVPGVFKGISGGEKRRLAFASEVSLFIFKHVNYVKNIWEIIMYM
jgi:ABC-type multidrug transport system ATPase subunit